MAAGAISDWNNKIDWIRLDEALRRAPKENKPIFTLIHQDWCGACKALKGKFSKSKEIEKLSKFFLMVNAGNSDEPHGATYRPDGLKGGYYPRIIFQDPSGKRVDSAVGPNPEYKAFYGKPEDIAKSMRKVAKELNIDLEAAEKKRRADEQSSKQKANKEHSDSVPSMLQAIFSKIDNDRNQVLSLEEFGEFVSKIGGQKPNAEQYNSMCKSYATPNGLTFDKMSEVYKSRGPSEIKSAYQKVVHDEL